MASTSTTPTSNSSDDKEEKGQECSGATTISALPSDIMTHILTLLDGPTLASAGCASTNFHSLTSHSPIWHRLCRTTWPSSDHPRVLHLISTFPSSFRSFFSDAFSILTSPSSHHPRVAHPPTEHLISAVDLRCRDAPIFSKVLETETRSIGFCSSPLRIDALDPTDPIPTVSCKNLVAELTLTWIVIDPVRCRAADLSSFRPVSVQRHWLSGETQVRFATIMEREAGSDPESDSAEFGIVVTCGEMNVREVKLQVVDMDGRSLNGRDSLGILQRGMGGERRMGRGRREKGEEMRERYFEYLKRKMERRERIITREGRLDMAYLVFRFFIFTGFLGLISKV